MSLVAKSFEADGLVIGENANFGIFSGGVLPHVLVPDAPIYSVYHRNNGDDYKLMAIDGSVEANWVQQNNNDLSLELIFVNANGTRDDISISGFNLPFYNSNGTRDDIKII